MTVPMLVALPMPIPVTPMPMAVPMMDTSAMSHTTNLGASLRDRLPGGSLRAALVATSASLALAGFAGVDSPSAPAARFGRPDRNSQRITNVSSRHTN